MSGPVDSHVRTIAAGDRRALAQAITLVESTRAEDQAKTRDLLNAVLPRTGQSLRIGITGVPGVGKSTFIDAFGSLLTKQGHKVAVLAVDPSSGRSGGSILGDKTRMPRLAVDENAYIRPSPAGKTLGGAARATREAMLLCEAAGFDIVLVETVGVGQSEHMVAGMVDVFLVLMLPGAGDELQGIKKGILELADILAVNKADGDTLSAARRAAKDYIAALRILEAHDAPWRVPVLTCSGREETGLSELWQTIQDFRTQMTGSGAFRARRQDQAVRWMWAQVEEQLLSRLHQHPEVKATRSRLEAAVRGGTLSANAAATELLTVFGMKE